MFSELLCSVVNSYHSCYQPVYHGSPPLHAQRVNSYHSCCSTEEKERDAIPQIVVNSYHSCCSTDPILSSRLRVSLSSSSLLLHDWLKRISMANTLGDGLFAGNPVLSRTCSNSSLSRTCSNSSPILCRLLFGTQLLRNAARELESQFPPSLLLNYWVLEIVLRCSNGQLLLSLLLNGDSCTMQNHRSRRSTPIIVVTQLCKIWERQG